MDQHLWRPTLEAQPHRRQRQAHAEDHQAENHQAEGHHAEDHELSQKITKNSQDTCFILTPQALGAPFLPKVIRLTPTVIVPRISPDPSELFVFVCDFLGFFWPQSLAEDWSEAQLGYGMF